MSKINLSNEQSGTSEYNSTLLHLNVFSEVISLLNPKEETSFTEKNILYDDKSYTISKNSYAGASCLYVSCSDGRKLVIRMISTTSKSSNQELIELSVSYSKSGVEFLCFKRDIDYGTFSTLSPDSLATELARLSWSYIEKNKDKLFSEEELDFICDIITKKTRRKSEIDIYRKRALDFSMRILRETLEGPKKRGNK